ncbi:MAG: hypothetical protein H0X37_12115 [Herpetosiphonaceae bacterium]|nr:hypothetical protein [Herpetosiphonaceae bacterium]
MTLPTLTAMRRLPPPPWATMQRLLIDTMNAAVPLFQERYTRPDGSLIWRQTWPGMDGSDDGYESFGNWALFSALGGSRDVYERSRFLWEAITLQFATYGQIWREFDAFYDWMHHGESSGLFYSFGLADPALQLHRARAQRFAHMYMGLDPEAANWDAEHRILRSPINGSKGPRLVNEWDDWSTHRAVLAAYPAPFEDIPGVNGPIADWNDGRIYGEILKLLNARQMQGDVPLNLTATSLVTHAYAWTGDERYRSWVLDYIEAWAERIKANDGLSPDNVGPSGQIGELMGGKWWGGYYGWRWPHGLMTIIQPLTIAAMNAVLLTGDMRYLDIPRSQVDRMVALGHVENGQLLVPHRHTDQGWTAFRPLAPEHTLQLWALSQAAQDADRLAQFPERLTTWPAVLPGRGKGDDIHSAPWYCYLQGRNPDYPAHILAAQWSEMARRMDVMRADDGDPEQWDVHHWQDINPVHTEALLQLTCGGPQIIYHGGLLHVPLRYFDAETRRPGLPPDVSALVHALAADHVAITLVNTSPLHARRLLIQAGAFGEHSFTSATDETVGTTVDVQDRHLRVLLPPGRSLDLRLGLHRYAHQPSYKEPEWL